MNNTLNDLSDLEIKLYNDTIALTGTMENMTQQLINNGIFEKYRQIHNDYWDLYNSTTDDKIKLEIIKRMVFLNWYSALEPNCFTGIDNLDASIIFNSYSVLNDYITSNNLDDEFNWMLSFYSSWEYLILGYSESKLYALTKFVKSVDSSVSHVPNDEQIIMINRGQMGIYWSSLIF